MARRLLGFIAAAGQRHPLGGPTHDCDVGKAFYDVDGHVQIESDDQLARRRTTNDQLLRLQAMEDLVEAQCAHNQRLRRFLDALE